LSKYHKANEPRETPRKRTRLSSVANAMRLLKVFTDADFKTADGGAQRRR